MPVEQKRFSQRIIATFSQRESSSVCAHVSRDPFGRRAVVTLVPRRRIEIRRESNFGFDEAEILGGELGPCVQELMRAGYPERVPYLEQKVETDLLRAVKNGLNQVLEAFEGVTPRLEKEDGGNGFWRVGIGKIRRELTQIRLAKTGDSQHLQAKESDKLKLAAWARLKFIRSQLENEDETLARIVYTVLPKGNGTDLEEAGEILEEHVLEEIVETEQILEEIKRAQEQGTIKPEERVVLQMIKRRYVSRTTYFEGEAKRRQLVKEEEIELVVKRQQLKDIREFEIIETREDLAGIRARQQTKEGWEEIIDTEETLEEIRQAKEGGRRLGFSEWGTLRRVRTGLVIEVQKLEYEANQRQLSKEEEMKLAVQTQQLKDALKYETGEIREQLEEAIELESNEIREELEGIMETQGFNIPLQVIPPERLWGLCAEGRRGALELTDIGKAVITLYEQFPSISIFLIAGIAKQATGAKPRSKERPWLGAKSFSVSNIFFQLSDRRRRRGLTDPIPPTDVDLIVAVSTDDTLNLASIARLLNKTVFRRVSGGMAEVVHSKRRDKCVRVDFGIHGWFEWLDVPEGGHRWRLRKRRLMGHILPLPLAGEYDLSHRLLPYFMTQSTSDAAIQLVSHHDRERKRTLLWGVGFNPFQRRQEGSKRIMHLWNKQEYYVAHYPFPRTIFPLGDSRGFGITVDGETYTIYPLENPSESLFTFGRLIRGCPWDNVIPLIRLPGRSPLTDEQLRDKVSIRGLLARETQKYLTSIVYSLARDAGLEGDKRRFGTYEQRREAALSLLEDIRLSVDGDPLAIVRCFKAGVSYFDGVNKQGNEVPRAERIYDLPPWFLGLGIFDENGLFPGLGKFLEERGTGGTRRRDALVLRMKKCPHGGVKYAKTRGSDELIDFLFKETKGDALRVAELLKPILYPGDTKEFIRDLLRRQEELPFADERFRQATRPPKYDEDIITLFTDSPGSVFTTGQIADTLGLEINQMIPILARLRKEGYLFRQGGGRKGKERKGVGTGGGRAYWARRPEDFDLLLHGDPAERALMAIKMGLRSPVEIFEATRLNSQTVAKALGMLSEEGVARKVISGNNVYWFLQGEEANPLRYGPSRERVIAAIRQGSATHGEIQRAVRLGGGTVSTVLGKLQEEGLVEVKGKGRATTYILVEHR